MTSICDYLVTNVIEIIAHLLICLFIEFLNICQSKEALSLMFLCDLYVCG